MTWLHHLTRLSHLRRFDCQQLVRLGPLRLNRLHQKCLALRCNPYQAYHLLYCRQSFVDRGQACLALEQPHTPAFAMHLLAVYPAFATHQLVAYLAFVLAFLAFVLAFALVALLAADPASGMRLLVAY